MWRHPHSLSLSLYLSLSVALAHTPLSLARTRYEIIHQMQLEFKSTARKYQHVCAVDPCQTHPEPSTPNRYEIIDEMQLEFKSTSTEYIEATIGGEPSAPNSDLIL
jgi:hypothetical protein